MKKEDIIKILNDIERNEEIEILYACEAGSRVWGFANDSSDYDIRFIYRKINVKEYLSLKSPKEVIEYMGDDMDIVGWDIRKALNLHRKCNPSLREWLMSSQVYMDKGIGYIFDDLGGFDMGILKNHYSAIAIRHWRKYSSLDFNKRKTKKYLYVIRSILCWNVLNNGHYPPLSIHELLDHDYNGISEDLKEDIHSLISYHQDSGEISEEVIFRLDNFIMKSLKSMHKVKANPVREIEAYDERFREILLIS